MARAVTAPIGLACLALAMCSTAALAMGPGAPFVPATATVATASEGFSPAIQGLSGIKLGRQPRALIDGIWVAQGATVRDDAVLTAIERRAVQLRHADGTLERLEMFPGVAMTRSSRRPPAPSPTRKP